MARTHKRTPRRPFVCFGLTTFVGLALMAYGVDSAPGLSIGRGSREAARLIRTSDGGFARSGSGLLYVVDSRGNNATGQILIVDPSDGTTKNIIPAGNSPDAVLSPDGAKLYVWSGLLNAKGDSLDTVLQEYDTESGKVINTTPNPDPIRTNAGIYESQMLMSESGNWIYMMKYNFRQEETSQTRDYSLSVFDTAHDSLLPTHASFPGCRAALLLPTDQELTVDVVCIDLPYVTEVFLSELGDEIKRARLSSDSFRPNLPKGWGAAFPQPTLKRVSLNGSDGHGYSVDRSSGIVRDLGENFDSERNLGIQHALFSKSRGVAYFISGHLPAVGMADFYDPIICVDSETLVPRATMSTSGPLFLASR